MKSIKRLLIGTVLAAVVILGVGAVQPQKDRKWEYVNVTSIYVNEGSKTRLYYGTEPNEYSPKKGATALNDGHELFYRNLDSTVLKERTEILNLFGSFGWELVEQQNFGAGKMNHGSAVLFKREK